MKKTITLFLFLFFLCCLPDSFGQKHFSNNSVHLKGKILIVHCYRGGVEPDELTLQELKKPMPLINEKLFLKKTYYGNSAYTIVTDSSGNFDLNIKPGLYNIYLANEHSGSKKIIDSTDYKSACEEQYKTQSHGQLKVYNKGNSPVEITIRETMNPCGPLPPTTEPKQN